MLCKFSCYLCLVGELIRKYEHMLPKICSLLHRMRHFLRCPEVYLHPEFTAKDSKAESKQEKESSNVKHENVDTTADMNQSVEGANCIDHDINNAANEIKHDKYESNKTIDDFNMSVNKQTPASGLAKIDSIDDIMLAMKPGNKILVIAPAGLGKSYLSSHLVRLWTDSNTLQNKFNLVLLLPLRLVNNHSVPIEYLFCNSNEYNLFPPSSEGQLRRMLKFNSRKVLFIFDGYDEIPERNQKRTVINDVISGKVASKASVIVTSRSQFEDALSKLMSEFVSISLRGMSDQSIDGYIYEIHQASQDTKYTKEAMQWKIRSMLPQKLLKIPLLLSFACFLWQMGSQNSQFRLEDIEMKNVTDILGQVLGLFISLYVEKLDSSDLPLYTSTLDDKIPTEIKLVLAKIHEMCFECFVLNKFIFQHDTLIQYGLNDYKVL